VYIVDLKNKVNIMNQYDMTKQKHIYTREPSCWLRLSVFDIRYYFDSMLLSSNSCLLLSVWHGLRTAGGSYKVSNFQQRRPVKFIEPNLYFGDPASYILVEASA
jgi:hypothetical protein